jgi:putative nucleotidyltransferase with HDIG domain
MYSPEHLAALDSGRQFRAKVLRTRCLPPIPQTLLLLLEAIQNEASSASEVENTILRDQALTAKVMRVANSAYYGRCGKVSTVSRAVATIGLNEVRNICLCALLMEHFHAGMAIQREQESLWLHSFAAAGIARAMVQWRPWISNEEAYVLGLLHDIGRMVLMIHFPEDYQQIVAMAQDQSVSYYLAEVRYGMPHTHVGKWLAIKWHLPEVYQKVIEYHHQPLDAPESQKEVKLVFLANILAHSETHDAPRDDNIIRECCSSLYISVEEWQCFRERSETIRDEACKLWNILK